mmetsp:Transcript_69951/g.116165  ORF Transcript_69951/g.116165 Transcript_69951/m.116165 type:complete len:214 (+) Transcript_69951:147-788(+)
MILVAHVTLHYINLRAFLQYLSHLSPYSSRKSSAVYGRPSLSTRYSFGSILSGRGGRAGGGGAATAMAESTLAGACSAASECGCLLPSSQLVADASATGATFEAIAGVSAVASKLCSLARDIASPLACLIDSGVASSLGVATGSGVATVSGVTIGSGVASSLGVATGSDIATNLGVATTSGVATGWGSGDGSRDSLVASWRSRLASRCWSLPG